MFGTHLYFELVSEKARLFFLGFGLELVPVRFLFGFGKNEVVIKVVPPKSVCRKVPFIDFLVKFVEVVEKIASNIRLEVVCLKLHSFVIGSRRRLGLGDLETEWVRRTLLRRRRLSWRLRLYRSRCRERVEVKISKVIIIRLRVGLFGNISKICERVIFIFLLLDTFYLLFTIFFTFDLLKVLIIDPHFKFVDEVGHSGNSESVAFYDVSVVEVYIEDADS